MYTTTSTYSEQDEYDPSMVRDIIERRNDVFDENSIRDVTLYVAHVTHDRPVRNLARQTGQSMRDIEQSIEYVRSQLQDELGNEFESAIT